MIIEYITFTKIEERGGHKHDVLINVVHNLHDNTNASYSVKYDCIYRIVPL